MLLNEMTLVSPNLTKILCSNQALSMRQA